MKRLGYAAISGQKMIQIRQRLDVLFLLYYSYRCKLTNGSRAYDRIVLPDAKRTKTVSNAQSEVIKVLNSGKNKNSYTTYCSCITILFESHSKTSVRKNKQKNKTMCIKVFRKFPGIKVRGTIYLHY